VGGGRHLNQNMQYNLTLNLLRVTGNKHYQTYEVQKKMSIFDEPK